MELRDERPRQNHQGSSEEASGTLAEYLQPGERDYEGTILKLLSTLDNNDIAEALIQSDDMEHHNGGRQDQPRPAGPIPH